MTFKWDNSVLELGKLGNILNKDISAVAIVHILVLMAIMLCFSVISVAFREARDHSLCCGENNVITAQGG